MQNIGLYFENIYFYPACPVGPLLLSSFLFLVYLAFCHSLTLHYVSLFCYVFDCIMCVGVHIILPMIM